MTLEASALRLFGLRLNSSSQARHSPSVMLAETTGIISCSSRSRWGSSASLRAVDRRQQLAVGARRVVEVALGGGRELVHGRGDRLVVGVHPLDQRGRLRVASYDERVEPFVLAGVVGVQEAHHPEQVLGEGRTSRGCAAAGVPRTRRCRTRSRRSAEWTMPIIRVSAGVCGSIGVRSC